MLSPAPGPTFTEKTCSIMFYIFIYNYEQREERKMLNFYLKIGFGLLSNCILYSRDCIIIYFIGRYKYISYTFVHTMCEDVFFFFFYISLRSDEMSVISQTQHLFRYDLRLVVILSTL